MFEEHDDVSLSCSVKLNHVNTAGSVTKSVNDPKVVLRLVRNEFRDILLKIESLKMANTYCLKDISLHTRFVKEGKATIKLTHPNVQLLISNCPPSKLSLFLKMVIAKTERLKQEQKVSAKQRLMSEKSRKVEEISPLSAIDVNILSNVLKPINGHASAYPETPRSSKRKFAEVDKENVISPTQNKIRVARPVCAPLLTGEQKRVMSAVMSGRNVFFTGSAGTGKSFLLKRILGALAPDSTFATASTGVAACQIGGITLHAFAGIGSGSAPVEQYIEKLSKKGVGSQWKKCQHLIVDEISMLDGEVFQKLSSLASALRNNKKPFGGIQLILSGDFLQLPPVCKSGQKRTFCFQTSAWQKCVDVNIELTQVKRQKDPEFISILQSIRKGSCSDEVFQKLQSTCQHEVCKDGILATRLSTHKDDVNFINNSCLEKLAGDYHAFHAIDSDPGLVNFLSRSCALEEVIKLKVGSQVMLTKNLDVQRGLVNGARGVITSFENGPKGLPIVKFMCGITRTIGYEKWTVRGGGGLVHFRKMLPLKLAWAISIHKSQGMTLDCVEVSLLRVFECGQAYVALSRARSLDGLRVLDIEPRNIKADPAVLKFYSQLEQTVFYEQTQIDSFTC